MTALVPLLKKPTQFSKFLNKARKDQQVNLKAKMLKKLAPLLVRNKVCEAYLLEK